MMHWKLPILFALVLAAAKAELITETRAIERALQNNPDIRIELLEFEKDQFTLRAVEADGKLQASVRTPLEWSKSRTVSDDIAQEQEIDKITASAGLDLSHAIPGGGSISASAAHSTTQLPDTDSAADATSLSLSLRQPLLKGFGKGSDVYYRIYQQRNQYQMSKEQFRNNMASALSSIRREYWDWISKRARVKVRNTELEYAQKEIDYQRARFRVGEVSALDTLSASIELLRAQSSLAAAEQSEKNARRKLALSLSFPEESLQSKTLSHIPIGTIPPMNDLIAQAETTSTTLNVLDLTRRNLDRLLAYRKNHRLPLLDATASYARNTAWNAPQTSSNDIKVGLSLSYDLLQRTQKFDVRKAEHDLEINRIKKNEAVRQLRSDIEGFYDAWRTDSLRYSLQSKQVQLAQTRHQAMLEEEKLGEVDLLTRIKVKNDLIEAQIEKLDKGIVLKTIEISLDETTKNVFTKFGVELP